MKNLLITVCLISAACLVSADAVPETVLAEQAQPAVTEARSEQNTAIILSSFSSEAQPLKAEAAADSEAELKLLAVNGLSLYDDRSSVIRKLGEPSYTEQDEHFADVEMLHYPDMTLYFVGDYMDFVEIASTATSLVVDDVKLAVDEEAIRAAFGEPDYVAEDGIVFERNGFALKLFLDETTGKLTSITYFYI
jgi:hypothetical protein